MTKQYLHKINETAATSRRVKSQHGFYVFVEVGLIYKIYSIAMIISEKTDDTSQHHKIKQHSYVPLFFS